MQKTIKIKREVLYSTKHKQFETKKKGSTPEVLDKDELVKLIKAMKNQ